MDILVPDRNSRHRAAVPAHPNEARIWGLVAAAVVLGFLFLVGAFERGDRVKMAANEPTIVRSAPALLVPEFPSVAD